MKISMAGLMLFVCCFACSTVQAQELRVVEVGAPAINCLFDPACRVGGDDTIDVIPIPASGTHFLQSRTLTGRRGSAAAGLYIYQYRIDLRRAVGMTYVPCLNSMSLAFGPVVNTLDFDGNGKVGDEVFVVTRGGLGTVGLASAEKAGNVITFHFSSPVCAGGRPGDGQSTFFFGLVSTHAPGQTTATVLENTGTAYQAQARAARLIGPRQRRIGPGAIIGQPPPGQNRAADVNEAVIDRLGPRPCVDRGGTVTIYGSHFGPEQGTRLVELGGHGIGVLLRVRSWSDTRITAIVPNARRIEYGQWYYIGLQDQDRHWISNISRTINICRQLM